MVAVEATEHVGPDDLVGRSAGRTSSRQVDDAVHDRQQRVHLMGGQEYRDGMLLRQAVQQSHDLLGAPWIEVGERLVEQEQLRPADECVGDQDPLLFAS